MIILTVSGEPISRREGIGNRRVFDLRAKEKIRIRRELKEQYDGDLLDCPLRLDYIFYLTIPKSAPKKRIQAMLSGDDRPTKRPDCSNLIKLLEDVLTGIVYVDDRFIVSGNFNKLWAKEGKTIIRIQRFEDYLDKSFS